MQEWNSPAIDKMVTLMIQRSLAKADFYSDDTVVELAKGVSKKAHGVFLRARFAVNELREGWSAGLTLAEIKKSLEKFPDELEDIYARVLKNLKPEQRQEAAYLLQLVCYAKRTLTLHELYVAMVHAAGGEDLHIKQISEREIEGFKKKSSQLREVYSRCFRVANHASTRDPMMSHTRAGRATSCLSTCFTGLFAPIWTLMDGPSF